MTIGLLVYVILASLQGLSDAYETCNVEHFDGSFTDMYCEYGCCYYHSPSRHCCEYKGLSGGAIAGIVIGCLIVVAIVVIIGCCIWRSSRNSTNVTVIMSPQVPQVLGAPQGTTNSAYAQPTYTAYPISPPGDAPTQARR